MTDFGVLKTHDRAIDHLKNLGPAMEDIAWELLHISDLAFLNLADPTTRASWAPLAVSTLLERAKLSLSPAEILQRAGTLKRSLQI